jgi:hypothetical protein
MMSSNEIIGLTMMLLLVMALVTSQADATIEDAARAAVVSEPAESLDVPDMPFTATIEGHFNGKVLTLSIDTLAHFGQLQVDGD